MRKKTLYTVTCPDCGQVQQARIILPRCCRCRRWFINQAHPRAGELVAQFQLDRARLYEMLGQPVRPLEEVWPHGFNREGEV